MDLSTLYLNPASVGSFGGVNRLREQTGSDPTEWLRAQKVYSLYKPARRRFRRRKYIVSGIDSLWQADLADMKSISRWNEGYNYILVVIDVFSKYVWAEPVKSKDSKTVLAAFKKVLSSDERKPESFMTDKGGEFSNQAMKSYCTKNQINYYTSQNPDTKAAVAERVIRTLKSRLYRYFEHKKSWKYIDVLPLIVDSYNKSKHRSIGMAPKAVTKETEQQVRQKLYPPKKEKPIHFKYNVGNKVRIAREKPVFGKGYTQQWTDEIFTISQRLITDPPVYKLKDYNGEVITGTFYEPELQLVTDTGVYDIDKILRTRTRNGKKEFFVSWKGYPESMNSWVTDLI